MTTQRCSERVYDGSLADFMGHSCGKPVKVVRDGKPYCTIHDPVRVAEKREAQEKAWNDKWAARSAANDRQKVVNELCAGFSIELLESHAAAIRKYIEGLS